MRERFMGASAIRTAALAVLLGLAALPAAAQAPASATFPPYKAPRAPDGHPDLNGIWQAFTTANWDIQDHEAQAGAHPELMGAYGAGPAGQGIVEGDEIPYQPWALAKKKRKPRETNDRGRQQRSDSGTRRAIPNSSATCRACRARPTCRFRFRSCRDPAISS